MSAESLPLFALMCAVLLLELLGAPMISVSFPEASGKLRNILEGTGTGMLLPCCPIDGVLFKFFCEDGRLEPCEICPGSAWRMSLKNGNVSNTFMLEQFAPLP